MKSNGTMTSYADNRIRFYHAAKVHIPFDYDFCDPYNNAAISVIYMTMLAL